MDGRLGCARSAPTPAACRSKASRRTRAKEVRARKRRRLHGLHGRPDSRTYQEGAGDPGDHGRYESRMSDGHGEAGEERMTASRPLVTRKPAASKPFDAG